MVLACGVVGGEAACGGAHTGTSRAHTGTSTLTPHPTCTACTPYLSRACALFAPPTPPAPGLIEAPCKPFTPPSHGLPPTPPGTVACPKCSGRPTFSSWVPNVAKLMRTERPFWMTTVQNMGM